MSSPAGPLRIVRLSPPGQGALTVLAVHPLPATCPLRTPAGRPRPWPGPGRVVHARLVDGERLVDDVLVLGLSDGVEVHLHGGAAVERAARRVLARAGGGRTGCSPASGRGDAGGDGGWVPGSLRAARALLSCREGVLARLAEEGAAVLDGQPPAADLAARLHAALRRRTLARRLRAPPVVRLVGRSNAGKSTLFNALVGSARALTSPEPGTTRDTVRQTVALVGLPVVLEDTAGVDALGAAAGEGADLLVHLLRPDEPLPRPSPATAPPVLRVAGRADERPSPPAAPFLPVSGLTGEGVPALLERLVEWLGLSGSPEDDVLAPVDERVERVLVEAARRLR